MSDIRAFLAMDLSMDVLRRIVEAQTALRDVCAGAGWTIRWVPPPMLHVVLWYLGTIDQAMAQVLRDELGEPIARWPAPEVEAQGVELVRVGAESEGIDLSVSLEDRGGSLSALVDNLAEQMTELGLLLPERSGSATLRLGRVLRQGDGSLEELIAPWVSAVFGRSRCERLVLYRSDVHIPKADFPRLWALPFGVASAAGLGEGVGREGGMGEDDGGSRDDAAGDEEAAAKFDSGERQDG